MIFLYITLLLVSLFALVKASDIFVDSASSLATRLRVPKMVIALTIAAFGTCAPELAISFKSMATGNYDMTLANVIGSCVVNILLVIGIASIISPINIKEQTVKNELPILVAVTLAFFVALNDTLFGAKINGLSQIDAIILLVLFVFFLLYLFVTVHFNKNHKRRKHQRRRRAKYTLGRSIIYIILTLAAIALASDIAVDNAVALAKELHISQKVIAMTIIVIGTSLPELVMTVNASKKGEHDLAVGNIIGTNIFNICVVLGLPTLLFGGFTSAAFNFADTLVVLLAAIMYYLCSRSSKKLTRIEGIMMVMIFAAYYTYVFIS